MDWLSQSLIVLVVPLTIVAFAKVAKIPPETRDGKTWVEYGLPFKVFAILSVLFAVGLFAKCFEATEHDRMLAYLVTLFMGGMGVALFLEAFFVKIGYDNISVYCYSPWRSSRRIEFSDMEEPIFSNAAQWWVIPTRKNGKVRLHVYITGTKELLQKLQEYKYEK